jgi:hypothetical protein
LLIILGGDERTLAGVYTLSFLGVMFLFGFACVLLKVKRPDIAREEVAPMWAIIFGISGVLLGVAGNIVSSQGSFIITNFTLYFSGIGLLMFIMYERLRLLRLILKFTESVRLPLGGRLNKYIKELIVKVNAQTIVFFCKESDLSVMNKAVLYVRENEQARLLTFVHVIESTRRVPPSSEIASPVIPDVDPPADVMNPVYHPAETSSRNNNSFPTVPRDAFDPKIFHENVALLDNMYPKIRLNSLVVNGGIFDKAMVHTL